MKNHEHKLQSKIWKQFLNKTLGIVLTAVRDCYSVPLSCARGIIRPASFNTLINPFKLFVSETWLSLKFESHNKRMAMVFALLFGVFLLTACGSGGDDTSYTVIREPNIKLSETSPCNFGGVVVNNSTDKELIITNNGTNPGLGIQTISTDSPAFTIISDACTGKSLAVNESCVFVVRFSPSTQGMQSSTLSIPNNDEPMNITLNGEGYALNVWINKIVTATCPQVVFDVTVINPIGSLGALTKDNFTLTQNGAAPTNVIVSAPIAPDPVSVVLALDLSGSLASRLQAIKDASKYFINQLREGTDAAGTNSDEAAICKFRSVVDLYPTEPPLLRATVPAGKTALNAYIDQAFDVPDGTALYEAIYNSITRAAQGSKSKKAVIILSDGYNELSAAKTLTEVIAYAQEQGIPLFTIFYVDYSYAAKPDIMKQLARETGGQYYQADNLTMETTFGQISSLFGQKYTITYTPPSCTASQLLRTQVQSGGLTGVDTKTILFP